jgi:hypothetical protein
MVGQLEYSLMPSRTAGSWRTLTVSNFVPVSFKIWMTWAENPHCGKCLLPFMKRRTRFFLMSSSS